MQDFLKVEAAQCLPQPWEHQAWWAFLESVQGRSCRLLSHSLWRLQKLQGCTQSLYLPAEKETWKREKTVKGQIYDSENMCHLQKCRVTYLWGKISRIWLMSMTVGNAGYPAAAPIQKTRCACQKRRRRIRKRKSRGQGRKMHTQFNGGILLLRSISGIRGTKRG